MSRLQDYGYDLGTFTKPMRNGAEFEIRSQRDHSRRYHVLRLEVAGMIELRRRINRELARLGAAASQPEPSPPPGALCPPTRFGTGVVIAAVRLPHDPTVGHLRHAITCKHDSGRYSTHVIAWSADSDRWAGGQGHYDIPSLARALADMTERALGG